MEMLYGQDLRAHLHERGPFRARELLLLLRQVAVTLDKAHALGIVHRDLKPANLFLTRAPDGSQLVKILDFGVAQLARRRETELPFGTQQAAEDSTAPPAQALSASGIQDAGLFGTPWYMAPEQVNGEPAVPGTDGWALALIAFRLLTGESYWAPAPLPELLGEIVAGPRTAPSSVVRERGLVPHASLGKAFDAWFFRACALEPAARFLTATSEIEALSSALASDESA